MRASEYADETFFDFGQFFSLFWYKVHNKEALVPFMWIGGKATCQTPLPSSQEKD